MSIRTPLRIEMPARDLPGYIIFAGALTCLVLLFVARRHPPPTIGEVWQGREHWERVGNKNTTSSLRSTPTEPSAPVVSPHTTNLVISVPYDPKNINAIQRGLAVWSQLPPCRSTTSVDLVFTTTNNNRQEKKIRHWVANKPLFAQCFAHIRYETVDMSIQLDKWPDAAWFVYNWTMLHSPMTTSFEYVLQMEFDVSPVARYWLDRLIELTRTYTNNAWVIGDGIYRNGYLEMNGNALYHRTPPFISFLKRFNTAYGRTGTNVYDTRMASFEYGSIQPHMLVSRAFVNCDLETTKECSSRNRTSLSTWNHINNETLLVHSRNRHYVNDWEDFMNAPD